MHACMEAEMDGDIDGWMCGAPRDTYKVPPTIALREEWGFTG